MAEATVYRPYRKRTEARARELLQIFEDARSRSRRIPPAVRSEVLERDGHACVYCSASADLHIDHVHPHSRGGLSVVENLRALCGPCNIRKGTRSDADARRRLADAPKRMNPAPTLRTPRRRTAQPKPGQRSTRPGSEKTCTSCRLTLPHESFGRHRGRSDGLNSICRECSREAARRWKEANPEKVREIKRAARARAREAGSDDGDLGR